VSVYTEASVAAISNARVAASLANTKTMGLKSDAIRQLFCARSLAGIPYTDISKERRVSLRTLSYWANEMGLPRQKAGPRRQRWMPEKKPKIR